MKSLKDPSRYTPEIKAPHVIMIRTILLFTESCFLTSMHTERVIAWNLHKARFHAYEWRIKTYKNGTITQLCMRYKFKLGKLYKISYLKLIKIK